VIYDKNYNDFCEILMKFIDLFWKLMDATRENCFWVEHEQLQIQLVHNNDHRDCLHFEDCGKFVNLCDKVSGGLYKMTPRKAFKYAKKWLKDFEEP
jgi:hypothetical protein